jgi:hypothetical protein
MKKKPVKKIQTPDEAKAIVDAICSAAHRTALKQFKGLDQKSQQLLWGRVVNSLFFAAYSNCLNLIMSEAIKPIPRDK